MKKIFSLKGFITSVVAASVLVGCSNTEEVVQEVRHIPVEVSGVSFGNLDGTNQITGTIVSDNDVNIVPKASGELVELDIRRGDVVSRGDVIGRIDDTDERNALRQEESRLRQAQTGLQRAETGRVSASGSVAQAEASLRQAEAQLREAREQRENNLSSMDLDIRNAELAYEEARKNLERMEALYEDGLISTQQYEDAVNAESRAKISLDQVKLAESQARSEVSLSAIQASVDQARVGVQTSQSAVREAEIGVREAEASVEQAEIALEQAQRRLEDKVITAPASGEIITLDAELGELVGNQSPIAQIISLDSVKVSVNVTAEQLMLFERDDVVDIQVAGKEELMSGVISFISSTSGGSGLFTVEAEIDNSERELRPGMVATIQLDEVLAHDSIIVPTRAVMERSGDTFVFVVEEGVAIRKEIEVVRYDTEFTAISGDVHEDARVVIRGQNLLDDGDLVQIVEEE
ncbi:efflux RND transporter periplasmic adaptor subunit [Bacillus sp. FJAT-45350]|uniref:efflux RND transporter periplasmic adaptor subunit n=1 Tax=Bacillus sp. FJAT-45350 TaxID=2011014 RepID=UPI000BB70CB2|nr:efflux RND transporter periplasmic adaptor subunit [Bacillus sp. FJAT-45350]